MMPMTADDRDGLRSRFLEAMYRTPPSPSQADVEMVSLKLVTALERFDLRADIASRIRVILPCRVATGNLRAPKVLFVVMDDAVAVLGPIDWAGHLASARHPLDVILPWSEVGTIGFQFPEEWGPLPTPTSKKFLTGPGTRQIFLKTAAGETVRLVPDGEMREEFSSIARYTSAVLDRFDEDHLRAPDADQADHLRGLMRYLPDLQNSSRDNRVVLSGSLVQETDLLAGYLVIAGDTFGFFDYVDCLVDDIDEGSPLLYPVHAISGCSVMKPEDFYVSPRVAVEVHPSPWGDEIISLIVAIDELELPFVLSAGRDSTASGRQVIEQEVGKFLGLIDRGILK